MNRPGKNFCTSVDYDDFSIYSVTDENMILNYILKFKHIFPRLESRINDFTEFSKKLCENAHVYVCMCDNESCGFLAFYANDIVNKIGFITLIGLLDEYRGKHLGQRLLDYCQLVSITCGMESLRLEVDLSNTTAISFYEKNGFKQEGALLEESMYMVKKFVDGEKSEIF